MSAPLYTQDYQSPLGSMLLAATDTHLVGLWFYRQRYFASKVDLKQCIVASNDVLKKTQTWLDAYFAGHEIARPPLALQGSPFGVQVWQMLTTVPYGSTITYEALAICLGLKPSCARAVGNAVGHNPLAVIVPCHRVVGASGLGGYAGGLDRKRALLRHEGAVLRPGVFL